MVGDPTTTAPSPGRLVAGLVCVLAAIGFAFDTYELLMLPLVVRPALAELIGAAPGSPEFQHWVGRLFYIPALAGGAFGLLGGYLTDWLGRRRVLTGSILLYSFSAFGAALSTTVTQLLVMRCLTFIGVCVEFVAAVAWLSELFPAGHIRERVLGYTQAFASVGGLMVAAANSWFVTHPESLPSLPVGWLPASWGPVTDPTAPWRFTLASGLVPALPLLLIRPFLPESPAWRAAKAAGTLRRPPLRELLQPRLRRTTLIATLLVACGYGLAFGAIQQLPQIIPGLPEVQQASADLPVPQQKLVAQEAAAHYTKVQEVGGLTGRVLLAILAVRLLSKRRLLGTFMFPALLVVPGMMVALAMEYNPVLLQLGSLSVRLLHVTVFLAGAFVVGQFSFWGNYLPQVYPLRLRGTGESFAANIGGRMIGTSMAWVTNTMAAVAWPQLSSGPARLAATAASVAATLALVALLMLPLLREPEQRDVE